MRTPLIRCRAVMCLSLAAMCLGALVGVNGCSQKQPPNANKDIQKQQKNLMDAMDRIAAETAKRPAVEPAKDAAPSPAPAQEQPKPGDTKPADPGKP